MEKNPEFYIEKAAELLALLYVYGFESFVENPRITQLAYKAAEVFNISGGETPRIEGYDLIRKKIINLMPYKSRSEVMNKNQNIGFQSFISLKEAKINLGWVQWWIQDGVTEIP